MLRFVVRRLLLLIPILLGVSILVFLWIRALPGSPATALLGERATPEAIAAINEQYGLNDPIYEQYWAYLKQLASVDFGDSVDLDGSPSSTSSSGASRPRSSWRWRRCSSRSCSGSRSASWRRNATAAFFDHSSLVRVAARDLDPDLRARDHPQVHLRGAARVVTDRRADQRPDRPRAPDELLHPRRDPRRRPRGVLGRDQAPDPARDRARLDPARDHRADHARVRARRPERGLRSHRAGEGRRSADGRHEAHPPQRDAADRDDHRPPGGPAALGRRADRDRVRVARDRQLARRSDQGAQLSGAAGRDPLHRARLRVGEPDRRPLLRRSSTHGSGSHERRGDRGPGDPARAGRQRPLERRVVAAAPEPGRAGRLRARRALRRLRCLRAAARTGGSARRRSLAARRELLPRPVGRALVRRSTSRGATSSRGSSTAPATRS